MNTTKKTSDHKNLYINVHSSIFHKGQKGKITSMQNDPRKEKYGTDIQIE
jgi:hypothetical protein